MKSMDGKMVSLLSHSHLFTLNDVIAEHRRRMKVHSPTFDNSGAETHESLVAGYGTYDSYDKLDCRISRLAVESIVGTSLQEDIETRYSHLDDFHSLPGSVYFMMALEASNASVSLDIDDAADKFASLSLSSYPGENVKSLATEALRLIKVMQGGYCLPLRLGSDLLRKVSSTSCEHFNRWIHAKLDEVRELELQYKLKDPKLMAGDPAYSQLGPIALCGFLQEKYGSLITEKSWPALTSTLPVSNHVSVVNGGITPDPSNGHKLRCNYCKASGHDKNECPKLAAKRLRQKEVDNDASPSPPSGPPKPGLAGWRYLKPADPTQILEVDGTKYKWCGTCKCRATGKQGFFTTTHFTSEHVQKNVSIVTPAANHSPLPLLPHADDGFTPDSIPQEERLIFTGPWHCGVEMVSSVTLEVDDVIDEVTNVSSEVPSREGKDVSDLDPHDSLVSILPHLSSFWMSEIPNLPDTDGVESITFTHDENDSTDSAVSAAVEVNHNSAAHALAYRNPATPFSDVPVIATPIPPQLPNSTSFLLVDTAYSCIFDTRPPLSVVDLDSVELYPCDNVDCNSLGPGGFNCVSCPQGVYHTAMVKCHNCASGTGFLGDLCSVCSHVLYGSHIVMSGLPGQTLMTCTDADEDSQLCQQINLARTRFLFTGNEFVPFPVANCAPCLFTWEVAQFSPIFQDEKFYDTHEHHGHHCCEGDHPARHHCCGGDLSTSSDTAHQSLDLLSFYSALFTYFSWMWMWVLHGWRTAWSTFLCLSLKVVGSSIAQCSSTFRDLSFWSFVVSTFCWDLFELYFTPFSPLPGTRRRMRSRTKSPSIFPRHWMILSAIMLLSGFANTTAFTLTSLPLSGTYQSCLRLASLVQMSPAVVYDLHAYRYRQWSSLLA